MNYNQKQIYESKLDKLLIFFVVYTLIFVTFFSTLSYTLPFVLGIIFALLLRKPVIWVSKKLKISTWVSSLIVTILFFLVILTLLSWGIFSLNSEVIQLGKSIQSFLSNNDVNLSNFITNLQKIFVGLDPSFTNIIKNSINNVASKTLNLTTAFMSKFVSFILTFLSKIPYIIMVILFTLLSTYFFTRDITQKNSKISNLTKFTNDKVIYIVEETKKMLSNYLISYLLIISITFIETLIGFLLLKVKYAVILSIIAAIFDLLPILGIGSIYIPTAIIYLLTKNYFKALVVIVLYGIVSIIRQIIEPKIVSSSLGLHPVAVLAAIFIGFKANGILGMLFCIFLVVFYNILKKVDVL